MVDIVVFSRDAAMLLAQIGPVLVIAFVVEFRALAERASMEGRDVRAMLWIVFGSLTVLLLICLAAVNGPEDWRGSAAITAWAFVLPALILLVVYVAMAGWAAVRLTVRDAEEARLRADAADDHLRASGWKWFLRGRSAPIHVVAAIATRKDGRVLAARRRPDKTSAGKWEFPGGKVERGELPADALVREIREELKVKIRIIEPFASDVSEVHGRPIRLSCYKVAFVGRAPTSSSDHDLLRWVTLDELDTLDWSAPDLPAVRALTTR